ncbi:MAG: metalloregulator ArsR/SmtB family transcription factor [Asticcacaulis sp.]
MPDNAELFAALGDETRLQLVDRLGAGGPASIVDLTRGGQMTRQAVTKHLYVLEKAGLVQCVRLGRSSSWTLKHERLAQAQNWLEMRARQWDAQLKNLQTFVET